MAGSRAGVISRSCSPRWCTKDAGLVVDRSADVSTCSGAAFIVVVNPSDVGAAAVHDGTVIVSVDSGFGMCTG